MHGRLLLHQAMQGQDTLSRAESTLDETVRRLREQPITYRGNLRAALVNLARTFELSRRLDRGWPPREAYELDRTRHGESHRGTQQALRILNRPLNSRAGP